SEKTNRLLDVYLLKWITYLNHLRATFPPHLREIRQILFSNSIFWVNNKSSFQGFLCLVVAFLHDQTYSQIAPWLWQTIAHLDGASKSLFCLFPLAGLHKFQTALVVVLLLNELI